MVDRLVGELGRRLPQARLQHRPRLRHRPGRRRAPGAGLLGHNRAHLAWLDGVLDRHPDLILENCASGGMRMDYALLSRLQLQSTSDQQDLLLLPADRRRRADRRAARTGRRLGLPAAGRRADEVAFTMATALLGRLYLSGRLPDSSRRPSAPGPRGACGVYKAIRADLAAGGAVLAARPARLGRPLARAGPAHPRHHLPHGLAPPRNRRHGDASPAPPAGHRRPCRRALPLGSRAVSSWMPDTADLSLTLPTAPSAVLLASLPRPPTLPEPSLPSASLSLC